VLFVGVLRLRGALNSGFLVFAWCATPRPCAECCGRFRSGLGIEQNDATVAVEALLEIIHRFFRHPLGQVAGFDAIAAHFASTSFMMGSPIRWWRRRR